ncbi:DUF4132 domain-containing protein [Planctomicrobium piriforme]|nr:DUF4132 domain-containing protein [Planctomicrobium piriforme]
MNVWDDNYVPPPPPAWNRQWQSGAVINTLLKRKLPLQGEDLICLLEWCYEWRAINSRVRPVGSIVRALQHYALSNSIDDQLRMAMQRFAVQLRSSFDKQLKRQGTAVEQIDKSGDRHSDEKESVVPARPSPLPAAAGLSGVLEPFKRLVGMLPEDVEPVVSVIGPDRFPLAENSPLTEQHHLLSDLFNEVTKSVGHFYKADLYKPNMNESKVGQKLDSEGRGKLLLAAAERHFHASWAKPASFNDNEVWQSRSTARETVFPISTASFHLSREGYFDFLLFCSTVSSSHRQQSPLETNSLILRLEEETQKGPLTEGERYVASLFRASLFSSPPLGAMDTGPLRLTELIGDGASFCLVPGEVWADAVNEDFSKWSSAQRRPWSALFAHALIATAARPSGKWIKKAAELINAAGPEAVHQALQRWLPLVGKGQSIRKFGNYVGDSRGVADTMNDENATALRGLLWMIPSLPQSEELLRLVSTVALSAYKKVPGVGPRAVKVGNAAVYVLSELGTTDAVGQLAMLKVRVKFGTAQKEIEKAFNAAAEALGLHRDQIEEMGVPSYGLEADGTRQESLGDYQSHLSVTGSEAQLKWFDAKGKLLKSVPAKVKQEHKEELKDLQQSLKDIQGMLPAQRDRLDSLFLSQQTWPIDQWRERYHNHPLVGTIARRLLWCVDGTTALFVDGVPTDVHGAPIAHGKTAELTLWHPVGRSIEEVTAWRRRLEDLAITQPFKQAHREVYLLTDAERRTHTYSNRFAAHVLRQHQFNALCAARGWKNKLRLMVDDSYEPPYRELPKWGIRAEFWVEGAGGEYGTDTNESGVYLRLASDQVRFYRIAATANLAHSSGGGYTSRAAGPGQENVNEPLPVDQIPPLVFSEIMRDVDLFVGVSTVGNDPTWQDGGPRGLYRDYWQTYSFGELSGTAATRKQVLERLVPQLKIAGRCSFSDRFLVVRGQKRTYKIHLGSGNILMEPNDQYLCIVPDSRSRTRQDDLFLPFEGDNTLSIILSKALLLADDAKIKDPTITRQINGH